MISKTLLLVTAVAAAALVASAAPGIASAGTSGWVGSRYQKSDCTYNKDNNVLYCQAYFTNVRQATDNITTDDPNCASGLHLWSRTGTLTEVYLGYDWYLGPVPLAKNNQAGDEGQPTETWSNYTDTDLGCV